jgi:hypothetical protein
LDDATSPGAKDKTMMIEFVVFRPECILPDKDFSNLAQVKILCERILLLFSDQVGRKPEMPLFYDHGYNG